MELATHNFGFEGNLPEERIHFKIKSSAKLFNILSDGLYEDKLTAPIRELSCNAYDAHIAANKAHVPFKIKVPSWLDATFSITDEGTGIDPAKIGDIFWTYGESTKTDSNAFIGALGLGSKSPFAYTKSSFTVKNRYQGVEHIYLCFINEVGEPDGSLLSSLDTTDPDGITIEFAVKNDDVYAFTARIAKFFSTWDATMPVFSGDSNFAVPKHTPVMEGSFWKLLNTTGSATAIMGNVPYPINYNSIPNLPDHLLVIAQNPFLITFPMGSLNFAASREALQYDERTVKAVIAQMELVHKELAKRFQTEVFSAKTHLEFMRVFREKFKSFQRVVRFFTDGDDERKEQQSQLLLNHSADDPIAFRGVYFDLDDLLAGRYEQEIPEHVNFGLYDVVKQSSLVRLKPVFDLRVEVKAEMLAPSQYVRNPLTGKLALEVNTNRMWEQADAIGLGRWRPATVNPKSTNVVDRTLLHVQQHGKKYAVVSTGVLIENLHDEKATIIINDEASTGIDRLKAYVTHVDAGRVFFANTTDKNLSVDDLVKGVKTFAKKFTGAKVVLISELPDHRVVHNGGVRAPAERGVMKFPALFVDPKGITKMINNSTFYGTIGLEKITLKTADLKAAPAVYFTLRDRAQKVFDGAGERSILRNQDTITRVATNFPEVFKNLLTAQPDGLVAKPGFITVINITESQIEYFEKRGIKLKLFSDALREELSLASKTVLAEIDEHNKVLTPWVQSQLDRLTVYVSSGYNVEQFQQGSLYRKVIEFCHSTYEVKAKKELAQRKLTILNLFITVQPLPQGRKHVVNPNLPSVEEFSARYPMLTLVNRTGTSDLIVDYVHQCDARHDTVESGVTVADLFKSNLL